MKQAEFTLWPWGVLAAAVPAMGIAGVAIFRSSAPSADLSSDPILPAVIFLSAIAAGNAYVLALATGDFGRSLLALPVGASASFLCVHLLATPKGMIVYLFIVALIVANFVFDIVSDYSDGNVVAAASFFAGTTYAIVLAGVVSTGPYGLVVGFIGVCGCVGASMATSFERSAIYEAGMIGAQSGMLGMTAGGACGGCIIFALSMFTNRPTVVPVGVVIGVIVANVTFINYAMLSTYRIESEEEIKVQKNAEHVQQ